MNLWFLAIKFVLLSLFTGGMIYRYASKKVGFVVLALTYISWTITFSPLILLPDDIFNVSSFLLAK